MGHKDYTRLRDQLSPRRPSVDLNGDGIGDLIIQGALSEDVCGRIKGCAIVDGYACAPRLKVGSGEPLPFSRPTANLSRLFGKATVFTLTQTTTTQETSDLRFFPDDPDGSLFENPASFALDQVAGYFDPAGKFVSFKIEGFAVGMQREDVHHDILMRPARDKTGHTIRIAYGKGPDGKPIEKPLSELIWAHPDGQQAIDPQVLVAGGTKDRPLSEAETALLPLFKRAQGLALKYKKMQQKETGARDLRGVRLTSLEIRRQARHEMEAMLSDGFPIRFPAHFPLRDGVRIALGKVVGLRRVDLVLSTIEE